MATSRSVQLSVIRRRFRALGCDRLYAKILSPNDNSKNQIYLGPSFDAVQLLPNHGITGDVRTGRPNLKARLSFAWLDGRGRVSSAPNATLILYPQYPEVRLSGFLRGCRGAPSGLMRSRKADRVLLLGVRPCGDVIAFVLAPSAPAAREALRLSRDPAAPMLLDLGLSRTDSRSSLLQQIRRIHKKGFIDSKRLNGNGELVPCDASNCGGCTLEAELGIRSNSSKAPDYLGWEVKQHATSTLARVSNSKPITLLTPEPDGGIYATDTSSFVRQFGYRDRKGRADRLNVGGRHHVNKVCSRTGLVLRIRGLDADGRKASVRGAVELVSRTRKIAASWSFAKLFEHWARKHNKAIYVPAVMKEGRTRCYWFGSKVRLAIGTSPLLLLKALRTGVVFYDPGIKLERASSKKPALKKRNQFRVALKDIHQLYERVENVDACK